MNRRIPSIKTRRSDRLSYITDRFITHKDKKMNEQTEQNNTELAGEGTSAQPLDALIGTDPADRIVYNDSGSYTWSTRAEEASITEWYDSHFKTPEPPAEIFDRAEFMETHEAVNDIYDILDRLDDEELRRKIMTLSERWTAVLRRVEPHFIKEQPRVAVQEIEQLSKGIIAGWNSRQRIETPEIDLRESANEHRFEFAIPKINIKTSKAGAEAIEKAFHEQYMKEYTEGGAVQRVARKSTPEAAEEWAETTLKYNNER